jgi:hypothetical protein
MKRFIAFSTLFALLSVAVFAEITVTGGASLSFVPIGAIIPDGEDAEIVAGLGRNGGVNTNMDLNFTGVSENDKAGFKFELRPKVLGGALDVLEVGAADLWIKPVDWIQIDVGKFGNGDIEGRMGAGAWFGDYTISRPGEGSIFNNFDGKAAVLASLKPTAVEGLGVYLLINNMASTYASYSGTWGASKGIGYIYENLQAAVSYAIPNIGLVRAQYKGAHPGIADTPGTLLPSSIWGITAPQIQAAFAFTGVSNLTIDVGGKYSLPVEDPKTVETTLGADNGTETKGTFKAPIEAGLGVKYIAGNLTATVMVDGKFAGSYELQNIQAVELGIEIRPWLTVNYKINDTFTAQAEGGIVYAGDSEQNGAVVAAGGVRYGFAAGLQTTIAPSCTLRSGVTYAGGEAVQAGTTAQKLDGVLSVPLIFSVSF